MAQTQTVTDTGIAELILLWREEAATGIEYIVCLEMATPCGAVAASTYADPADTATHFADSGLDEVAIATVAGDTVNTAGDTILFDHVFTADLTPPASKNVAGIHVLNNDAGFPTVTYIECCFNAVLAMEDNDTLTIDGQCTIDQA